MLECAGWLAAPFAGALLAELGATVIKVEPVTGDPYRRMPTNENMIRAFQGKKNIGFNLKAEEGLAVFYDLVKRADIVMHNYRPGVPDRLKTDYETLKAIKPVIVYVYGSAYGQALSAELEPIFLTRTANAWEADLVAKGIACVRADAATHLAFLHSDPQPAAMGFMVRTRSPEFLDLATGGRYWRHAPVVKFSMTPCEAGKPCEGPGVHTRCADRSASTGPQSHGLRTRGS